MNPHPIIPALLLVLGSSFAACGGDNSTSTENRSGPLPEDQFLPALLETLCDRIEPCCRAAGLPYNQEACRRQLVEDVGYGISPNVRDRFEYDPVAAGECIAFARRVAETCQSPYIGPCSEVYKGKTQPGEPCLSPRECARPPRGMAACEIFGDAIESRCRSEPRGAEGDRCHGTCTESFGSIVCHEVILYDDAVVADCYTGDGLYCEGTCHRLLPLGSACNAGFSRCERGAGCGCDDSASCETTRCVPKAASGGPCAYNENCPDDLHCDRDSLTCQKKRPAGAPCGGFEYEECEGSCDEESSPPVCVDPPRFPAQICNPKPP